MDGSRETTNLLLLAILFVLLAGFGFLLPIIWVAAALVGTWLLWKVLRVCGLVLDKVLDWISLPFEWLFKSNSGNWLIIGMIFAAGAYGAFTWVEYEWGFFWIGIAGLFSAIKLFTLWEERDIKDGTKDH